MLCRRCLRQAGNYKYGVYKSFKYFNSLSKFSDLGDKRVVMTDPNFPLEGTVSAIGRSIVIFGPNGSWERYACGNIEPDHDIVKYINIQKPPRFVVLVLFFST